MMTFLMLKMNKKAQETSNLRRIRREKILPAKLNDYLINSPDSSFYTYALSTNAKRLQ